MCISSQLYVRAITFGIFTTKMFQVPLFVIRCEDKFSKVRLSSELSKYSGVKCLLQTNLASSVKPINILQNIKVFFELSDCFVFG